MQPPPHVLAAFGAPAEPEPLGGGQGHAWRFGDLVLKFPRFLIRALIYRIVVDARFRHGEPNRPDADDCFLGPVELACRLAA